MYSRWGWVAEGWAVKKKNENKIEWSLSPYSHCWCHHTVDWTNIPHLPPCASGTGVSSKGSRVGLWEWDMELNHKGFSWWSRDNQCINWRHLNLARASRKTWHTPLGCGLSTYMLWNTLWEPKSEHEIHLCFLYPHMYMLKIILLNILSNLVYEMTFWPSNHWETSVFVTAGQSVVVWHQSRFWIFRFWIIWDLGFGMFGLGMLNLNQKKK